MSLIIILYIEKNNNKHNKHSINSLVNVHIVGSNPIIVELDNDL